MLSFTEDTFEQAVIELFENMGYTHIYAPDMNRTDYSRPLLDDVLRDCLVRLNRSLKKRAQVGLVFVNNKWHGVTPFLWFPQAGNRTRQWELSVCANCFFICWIVLSNC